jgi:predicted RNA-binding protein YlqC (UPF0109 family)
MRELVEIMAKALVDNPDQLEVSEIAGSDTLVIELKPAREDIGKIIGKKGRNVQAMRTLLNAALRLLTSDGYILVQHLMNYINSYPITPKVYITSLNLNFAGFYAGTIS